MAVSSAAFGVTGDGVAVEAFTLTSDTGASATILTYGGTLMRLLVPERSGRMSDVVLGFDNLQQYETQSPYFGATVGRLANRTAKGRFTLNGKTYQLPINNGPNSLHGGIKAYDKRVWAAHPQTTSEGPALMLTLSDPDGSEGFPGTVQVSVRYTLVGNNLRIDYAATADAPTPINLTNHSYFNLKDAGASDVLGHVVQINADEYTPVDETLIPLGRISPVKNTPLDFTAPKAIGRDLSEVGGTPAGYDHNFVLRVQDGSFAQAAIVEEAVTGRRMEVWTNQPGVQFYTGNFLDGSIRGKGGVVYKQHHGLCLETQHFPDSVNHPQFPSTILAPGRRFESRTEYRFSS